MKGNKGISLIVLVITIIVMIILAGAIILTLNDSGIISKANEAVGSTNLAAVKSEAELKYAEYLMDESVIGDMTVEEWLNEEVQHDGYYIKMPGKKVVVVEEGSLTDRFYKGEIKAGDFVDYQYDKAEGYVLEAKYSGADVDQTITQVDRSDAEDADRFFWRVLGVNEDGNLELVYTYGASNGIMMSYTPNTTQNIVFGGAVGYNNAVYLLHDMAKKLYSNAELGITARSLSIADIELQLTDAALEARKTDAKYMTQRTYAPLTEDATDGKLYNYYPSLYAKEIYSGVTGSIKTSGVEENEAYYISKDALTTADNAYVKTTNTIKTTTTYWGETSWIPQESYFVNAKVYDMLFRAGSENSGYWLASRFVTNFNESEGSTWTGVAWGLRCVRRDITGSEIDSINKYFSDGDVKSSGMPMYLCPIITIPEDVTIVTNENANSPTNMWTLSK